MKAYQIIGKDKYDMRLASILAFNHCNQLKRRKYCQPQHKHRSSFHTVCSRTTDLICSPEPCREQNALLEDSWSWACNVQCTHCEHRNAKPILTLWNVNINMRFALTVNPPCAGWSCRTPRFAKSARFSQPVTIRWQLMWRFPFRWPAAILMFIGWSGFIIYYFIIYQFWSVLR